MKLLIISGADVQKMDIKIKGNGKFFFNKIFINGGSDVNAINNLCAQMRMILAAKTSKPRHFQVSIEELT